MSIVNQQPKVLLLHSTAFAVGSLKEFSALSHISLLCAKVKNLGRAELELCVRLRRALCFNLGHF